MRFIPRRFARLVGESLNAALNPSGEITGGSWASVLGSLPVRISRGTNAGSVSGRAKLTFQRQTSSDSWRYDHPVIPPGTGVRA